MIITDEDVTGTAVRVHVADLSARIASNDLEVTEWAAQSFGSWWRAEWEPTPSALSEIRR